MPIGAPMKVQQKIDTSVFLPASISLCTMNGEGENCFISSVQLAPSSPVYSHSPFRNSLFSSFQPLAVNLSNKMIRSSTKTDLRLSAGASPSSRPLTVFQTYEGAPTSVRPSYHRALTEYHRGVTKPNKNLTEQTDETEGDLRPGTTELRRRTREHRSSDTAHSPSPSDQCKPTAVSPRRVEVGFPSPGLFLRAGHRPHPSLPPTKEFLSDYVTSATLGHGSFATVKKAIHRHSSTPVAIKTYEKYRLIDAHRKKGVAREIKILSQLDHVNIVKLLKVMEGPRHLHLVMEFVDGVSLYTYLRQKDSKRLTEADAREIFRQVMEGLKYLHGRGVAHRDLKLQNVLLDQQRVVKIIDFGFSTQVSPDLKMKLYCGTPNYMAPEILDRKEYLGAPADIWAAGVLLFTLLSGEFPFKGLNDRDLYKRIQLGTFTVPPHVSTAAKELVTALLMMDAEARPTAKEVLEFPWVNGQKAVGSPQRPGTSPLDVRSRQLNPLAAYDQEIMTRLVRQR